MLCRLKFIVNIQDLTFPGERNLLVFSNYVIDSTCFYQMPTICYKSEGQRRVIDNMGGKVISHS